MALLTTLFAGAFFLAGALVAWRAHGHGAVEVFSVAIAFGSLACVAAFDLLPEAAEASELLGWPLVAVLVAVGVAALVLLDRAVPDHHAEGGGEGAAHLGLMAVLAISVHNVAEGAAIFAIASQDLSAGLALAVGVGLHNAPMGMLLYSAFERSRRRGVATLSAAALSTLAGGLMIAALGDAANDAFMAGIVCLALGMIAYILLLELLPTMLRGKDAKRSIVGAAVGAAFVITGMFLE